MLLRVPAVFTPSEVAQCRAIIDAAEWVDGRTTAGTQAERVKNNLQIPESSDAALRAREMVVNALQANGLFFTAALPKKIFPPLFNKYAGAANAFGNHVDNAVRTVHGTRQNVRTDLSATLFLSAPADYDGGELVVEDTFGGQSIKLPAGDLILYPSSSVHRVQPVTRGVRVASFFWIESMVRDDAQRRILFDLDLAIHGLREGHGDRDDVVRLTGCYHNLIKMWAQP